MPDDIPTEIAEHIEEYIIHTFNKTVVHETCRSSELGSMNLNEMFLSENIECIEEESTNIEMNPSEFTQSELEFKSTDEIEDTRVIGEIAEERIDFGSIEHCSEDSSSMKISNTDKMCMVNALLADPKVNEKKWHGLDFIRFNETLKTEDTIRDSFTKNELILCIKSVSEKLKGANVTYAVSWKKEKLVSFFYNLLYGQWKTSSSCCKQSKRKNKVPSMQTLCVRMLKKSSKKVLSCIYAEYLFPVMLQQWRASSPFDSPTYIEGMETPINWYSTPEYVAATYTYLFQLLDVHHLFVNARVKCCSSGIKGRGIKREAWVKAADKSSENGCGLSLALVNDLVDKQSNAFAQKTFSFEVETVMRENGDMKEADFCKLIREWYAAEDDPGIDVMERIARRIRMREWLLEGLDFGQFPPYGTHIKGVPYVMFEGIMTNTERRIQIIPFVKAGVYNPRTLGSLEAENFFGEFQDLDPSGSGVIRADDIPKALSTACELIETRLDPNRKFAMHTSRAKVYTSHQLSTEPMEEDESPVVYMTPSRVSSITPRNHSFDEHERSTRKFGKRKRSIIREPGMASRGMRPIREHHRFDESKVLPHVRLGIKLPD